MMFEPDPEKTHFDLERGQIITLLNSTIRPHVAIAGPTEPADAFVCTFKRGKDLYETLIYFLLLQSNKGIVYHWDEGPQPRDNAKSVEKEALRFLDEMGFQMNSLHFRKQPAEEQQRLMDTLPCFHPPSPPGEDEMESLEAVAVEEADVAEAVDEIDDIAVESLEIESEFEEAAAVVEEAEGRAEAAGEQDAFPVEEEVFEIPEASPSEGEAFEEIRFEEKPAAEAEPEPAPVKEPEEVLAVETVPGADEYPREISLEEDFEELEVAAEVMEESSGPESAPVEEPAYSVPGKETAPPPAVKPDSAPEPPPAPDPQRTPPPPQKMEAGSSKTDMEGLDLEPLARFLASM